MGIGGGRYREEREYDALDCTHFDRNMDAEVPREESLSQILNSRVLQGGG